MRSERERLSGEAEDEIDLFELIEGLWKKKLLIILVAVVVTVMALAYVLLATPIYEAKVFVQAPSQNDIAPLNYGRGGKSELKPFTIKDVSGIYSRTLQSESLRREFFRKYYIPSLSEERRSGSQDSLYNQFKKTLTLGVVSKDAPDRFFVMAQLPDPRQASEWVARYVEMAGDQAKAEIIKDARADAMVKADNLEQLVRASRESARKQREDRIAKLTEALRVARSVGLEKPPIISYGPSSEVSADMDGPLTYMRGANALEAEIKNLRSRTSDDPFIENLREKQESLNFYRSLRVEPSVVQVYRQDGALESPDRPVKPNKPMIVALGAIFGVLLGGFLALIVHLWQARVRRD
ncbi:MULTISPECIES: LPS O-antigen chain length determinant protein WzzB [Pseudomonas]|uniref:LPS O-antigen chain length determinant protein WzzB n=1 Tax=Pseudomonas TaxID=286 RepID=UPI0005BBA651|nr:Wzz/FepE/Etk N-terminal domain-containing protein [Pseudomonas sp. CK-NBRI-02]TYO83376.1 hypothetical protein DQ397_001186 [Pseudomonas sp. CK-NBRI-02]